MNGTAAVHVYFAYRSPKPLDIDLRRQVCEGEDQKIPKKRKSEDLLYPEKATGRVAGKAILKAMGNTAVATVCCRGCFIFAGK